MLTSDTKRHIDAARQVLVGVVPNPTSQIDQITNALIYKFMDDMDQAAIKTGGKPSFFVDDLEKYAWTRIMDTRIGDQERMNLYTEALLKFSQAKQLPELFRSIFKSAFLPYRSPEVLGLFLKEIDYFDYSHPEELGNAYEYLLSIMSSQGDAGQFRTPRYIIDFMVDVVNPTKDDKILDPACGTAGFLISAYKHILEQHDGKDDPKKKEKRLSPEDKKKLINNFEGYDIDPMMTRIAQVNMYLHQFKNPKIYQYDTLSMEERWNDKFDVILANPPFMSPKGGIRPHNKFSVQSSRSEVLFVDYIMNHLRPKGRAGIIVPEGIIFQSGNSHKELRKNLVNDGLYAVVSLPSGVFAPYSGVKTSILFFDNELAKRSSEILFVKVENDGFDLGATKRKIDKNDLPEALEILRGWRNTCVIPAQAGIQAIAVPKTKIAENGDYNLSGDRYRVATDYTNAKWPMVELDELFVEIKNGKNVNQIDNKGKYRVSRIQTISSGYFDSQKTKFTNDEINQSDFLQDGDILLSHINSIDHLAKTAIFEDCQERIVHGVNLVRMRADKDKIISKYALYIFKSDFFVDDAKRFAQKAVNQASINTSAIKKLKIPLPPMQFQKQIVAELDGYAAIISGAKQIVQNWKPKIDIDPGWEKVRLGDIAEYFIGLTYSPADVNNEGMIVLRSSNIQDGELDFSDIVRVNKKVKEELIVREGDILMCSRNGSKRLVGKTVRIKNLKETMTFGAFMTIIRSQYNQFLSYFFVSDSFRSQIGESETASINQITKYMLDGVMVPLPTFEVQNQISKIIEAERELVESANKLIEIYEQKTKDVVDKIWKE